MKLFLPILCFVKDMFQFIQFVNCAKKKMNRVIIPFFVEKGQSNCGWKCSPKRWFCLVMAAIRLMSCLKQQVD